MLWYILGGAAVLLVVIVLFVAKSGGRSRRASSTPRRAADGLTDVTLTCPSCKRHWVAGFKRLGVPTRVHCPKCGWQGMMSVGS